MRNVRVVTLLITILFILVLFGVATAESTGDLTVSIDGVSDYDGAYVSVEHVDRGLGTTESVNDSGTVSFDSLSPGTYTVTAEYDGVESDEKNVEITEKEIKELSFTAPFDSEDPLNSTVATERFK